jgi:predicted dehydrogenase
MRVSGRSILSVLQVGAGMWGQSWAEVVSRGAGLRLVGVVDGARAARDWVESSLRVPTFARLGDALEHVACDAVLIVAPPAAHRPLAEESLAAGRHVAIEKPLALDLEDARAIAAAAARHDLRAIVTQNYRFRRQSRALQGLVESGRLGRLLGVRIACRRDLRDIHLRRDWRGQMPHPYVLDMAIHHVDLLRAITGREVATVDARSWPAPDGPFRGDTTLAATLTLAGGTPVGYEGTWTAATGWTSWNGDWELAGTKARVAWLGGVNDALRGRVVLEQAHSNPEVLALPRLPSLDRLAVLHELRRAVAAGVEPECSAADNVKSLAAALALALSTEERRSVEVAELLA